MEMVPKLQQSYEVGKSYDRKKSKSKHTRNSESTTIKKKKISIPHERWKKE